MSDYIGELESELVRAARERERRRRHTGHLRRGLSRITLGGVLTGLGAAGALAVAILAIALLGHRRPAPVARGAAEIPAAARSLAAHLAVLRRPQTAADRTAPTGLLAPFARSAGPAEEIAPGLTRLLATLPVAGPSGPSGGQERVFLIVAVPGRAGGRGGGGGRGGRGGRAGRGGQGGQGGRGGPAFGALAAIDTRGGPGSARSAPAAIFYTPLSPFPGLGGSYDTTLVPDGVVQVRWDFDGRGGGAGHPLPTTVYATVRDNLAFAPARRDHGQVTRVTWYGVRRRILRTVIGPYRQATQVMRVPAHPAPPAPQPSELSPKPPRLGSVNP